MAGAEDAADHASASTSYPRSSSSSLGVEMAAWSSVDKDLLLSIFSKLYIIDFIRSAAVCNTWSAAVNEFRSNLLQPRHQRPWLMSFNNRNASVGSFFSLSDSTAFSTALPGPPICDRHCIGSSFGWLIVVDQVGDLQLLNPITRKQIDLPPVTTMDYVRAIRNGHDRIIEYWSHLRKTMTTLIIAPEEMPSRFYLKASLTSDPSQGDDYQVVVIHEPDSVISFTRPGDRKWTTLRRKRHHRHVAFYRGRLYVVMRRRGVDVWDLSGPLSPPTQVVAPEPIDLSSRGFSLDYLVESVSGDLLLISWRKYRHGDGEYNDRVWTRIVKVFKVDVGEGRLIEVNSLGDDAIFLGSSTSIYLPCANFPELRPNSIYFTDCIFNIIQRHRSDEPRNVSIYSLEDGTFSDISSSDGRSSWLSPIWLQPNPY